MKALKSNASSPIQVKARCEGYKISFCGGHGRTFFIICCLKYIFLSLCFFLALPSHLLVQIQTIQHQTSQFSLLNLQDVCMNNCMNVCIKNLKCFTILSWFSTHSLFNSFCNEAAAAFYLQSLEHVAPVFHSMY